MQSGERCCGVLHELQSCRLAELAACYSVAHSCCAGASISVMSTLQEASLLLLIPDYVS
jgi:hypothetical protein